MTTSRRIALGFWLAVTVGLGSLFMVRPELLEPEKLVLALKSTESFAIVAYALLSVVRPVTMVPSTVLIIVGTLLFPGRYWMVFAVSLGGISLSAILIYYFFEFLGLKEVFERKHATRVRWLEEQLRLKGFWVVVGWAMFPFVPTDVICYVAGALRMHKGKFLLGITLGEIPVVAFYVTGATQLLGP